MAKCSVRAVGAEGKVSGFRIVDPMLPTWVLSRLIGGFGGGCLLWSWAGLIILTFETNVNSRWLLVKWV